MRFRLDLLGDNMTENKIDDYSRFDAAGYLRSRYPNPEDARSKFNLHCFHEFYQQYHTQWNHSEARVLELGGGPVIVPLISAAPFVSEIVFSEYAEDNRAQVQLWKDNNPTAHDWMPYFRYVVNKLEGNVDPEAATARGRLLRNRLSHIVSCDVNADQILQCEAVRKPFDIISESACIEAAVDSSSQYKKNVAKLRPLLKKGGLLMGSHGLGISGWTVQGKQYTCFPLTEDLIITSLQEADFSVLERKIESMPLKKDRVQTAVGVTALFVVAKAN